MQFILTVEDPEEFNSTWPMDIAKELVIILENEGYTVEVIPFVKA